MAAPILPRNASDPTGQDKRERAAIAEFKRRLRQVGKLYQDALKRIPYRVVTVNAKIYQFDLNPDILASILGEISLAVDRILLEGGPDQLWFTQQYVVPAYQQGTGAQWANLGAQSEVYQASRPTLEAILTSDPYRRRIGYLRAREFELMQGFTAETKSHMSRILADGLATGQNPLEVAKSLTKQLGIEERRAERIARTEIPTAFRQARLDEAQQAQQDLGIQSREMHLSALSPTTRPTHRARHATLHTVAEQRTWWTLDGNSINCYLPGTRVAGRFLAGSKARYEGPTVQLVAADGTNLTVTPNHPVMTLRGLVPAAEITERDYLIAYRAEVENPQRVIDLDDQAIDEMIENIFGALVQLGHSNLAGVRAVDFHGDAVFMDENVEVVRAERELPVAPDAALAQFLDDFNLVHADAVAGPTESAGSFGPGGIDLATPGGMRSLDIGEPFLGGVLRMSDQSAFSAVSGGQTSLAEPAHKHGARNPELLREFLDGHPGKVELVKVLHVWNGYFRGHVYDLEEVSGLMVANGIIASNCKCSTVTVLVDSKGAPLDPNVIKRAQAMKD